MNVGMDRSVSHLPVDKGKPLAMPYTQDIHHQILIHKNCTIGTPQI